MTDLVAVVSDFLYDYRFNNYMGLNPDHRPLAATDHRGVYALIRLMIGMDVRDAQLAEAVRQAGYEILVDKIGTYVERKSVSQNQARGDDDLAVLHSA